MDIVLAKIGDKVFNDIIESFAEEVYDVPFLVELEPSMKPKKTYGSFTMYEHIGTIKNIHKVDDRLIGTVEVDENNYYGFKAEDFRSCILSLDWNKLNRNKSNLKYLQNVAYTSIIGLTDKYCAYHLNKFYIDRHNKNSDRLKELLENDFSNLTKDDVETLKDVFNSEIIKERFLTKQEYIKPEEIKNNICII